MYSFSEGGVDMKIDESIRQQLLKNLERRKQRCIEIFDEYIRKITQAESVEEIMLCKKEFLVSLLEIFPIDASCCYFCLLHKAADSLTGCSVCEYARHHGICDSGPQLSDWGKIYSYYTSLKNAITKHYYKGETYD
jgi:hypothetical protein